MKARPAVPISQCRFLKRIWPDRGTMHPQNLPSSVLSPCQNPLLNCFRNVTSIISIDSYDFGKGFVGWQCCIIITQSKGFHTLLSNISNVTGWCHPECNLGFETYFYRRWIAPMPEVGLHAMEFHVCNYMRECIISTATFATRARGLQRVSEN